jgi:AcrR family transcriptional regulator
MSRQRDLSGTKAGAVQRVTVGEIADRALVIADTEGLTALTIRRLADELNVGAMTLYTYFRNKDEILDSIADRALGRLVVPSVGTVSPIEAVQALAHAFFELFREHPCIVALFSTRTTNSLYALKGAMEAPLKLLEDSGFSGECAVQIYGTIVSYSLGFAAYQAPRPWGHPHREDAAELRRQRKNAYGALPSGDFPTITKLSGALTGLPSDEQFEFGLDRILEGLAAIDRLVPASGGRTT